MKKKNNTTNKKLASAASMLLLSTAMLGMATYAWFTMNKEVSVTGMKVEATASEGLVISGDNKSTWLTDWDVAMTGGVKLYPTSTDGAANNTAWAVAYSDDFNDADKDTPASGYTDLNMQYTTSGTYGGVTFGSGEGVGYAVKGSGTNDTQNYVLKKTFYIKSTADNPIQSGLKIKSVTATASGGSGSDNINKALRVLAIVNNGGTKVATIYDPIVTDDDAIKFKNTTSITLNDGTSVGDAIGSSIGNTDGTAVQVDVYMFYDGEDQNCKSANITGIDVDTLNIGLKFTY